MYNSISLQAKEIWCTRLNEVSVREAEISGILERYEQQQIQWDEERKYLKTQLAQREGQTLHLGVYDQSETFAESQLASMQSALSVAEGVIEEQHRSYAALKKQVQLLEDEAGKLRVSVSQSKGATVLQKADAKQNAILHEQVVQLIQLCIAHSDLPHPSSTTSMQFPNLTFRHE